MRRQAGVPQDREERDEPFGPPPREYPYRCPVCGTELLVNEAIIDVGMGMAKFHLYSAHYRKGLCGCVRQNLPPRYANLIGRYLGPL